MFQDLGVVIELVQQNYDRICNLWDSVYSEKINLRKKLVISTRDDSDILDYILKYRSIINDENISIMFAINMLQHKNSSVTTRVKALNSIEYKLDNYIRNHEGGQIPIKKCLNDLLGIRIVIDAEFDVEDVQDYMKEHYPTYKCIDSSKNGYVATHIYFENGNLYFPWELQVWQKKSEKNNYYSHRIYKQDYTMWESLNKGGVEDV